MRRIEVDEMTCRQIAADLSASSVAQLLDALDSDQLEDLLGMTVERRDTSTRLSPAAYSAGTRQSAAAIGD